MQLSALISGILSGCFHRRAAWPQHNRQRCLACGSWRLYDLKQGIQGDWKPPERPQSEPSLGSGHAILQPPVPRQIERDIQHLLPVSISGEGAA